MIRWALSTLDGRPVPGEVTVIGAGRKDGTVTRALNDGRTATIAVSVFDPVVLALKPLQVILTARYFDQLVFAGVVQIPDHQGAAEVVEITAQDPSRRLDAAPLIDPRVTYASLDQIVEATRPIRYGYPDAPDHGIKPTADAAAVTQPPFTGLETSVLGSLPPGRGPFPRIDISRGASAWSVFIAASESMFGCEFDLRPIEHEPGTWHYVELDIARRLGVERQDDPVVQFHYGWGRSNCVDAGYAPGGDRVVDAYFQEIEQPNDADGKAVEPTLEGFYSDDEIAAFGFYAGYQGAGGCTGAAGNAIAQVAAYRAPPQFFSVQPAIERLGPEGTLEYGYYDPAGQWVGRLGAPPRYGRDYDVGDTIRVQIKRGYFRQDLVGRIVKSTLREVDDTGAVQVDLECVPRVDISGITKTITEFQSGNYVPFTDEV